MATYKISGTTNENATVRIFQGETYRGYKNVTAGAYEVIFDSTSGEDITAFAERADGKIGKVIKLLDAEIIENRNITDICYNKEIVFKK